MTLRNTFRTRSRPVLSYEVAGDGPTVLFLHGIGGNRRNWLGQLDHLSPRYRAVAIDMRGYGDSDGIAEPFEFPEFVDDVIRLLDELGAAEAHIVGLSMGGLIAQALYGRAPHRVQSLGLVTCRSAAEAFPHGANREEFVQARLGPLRAGGPARLAESLAPELLGPNASAWAREQVMDSLRRIRPDSYESIIRARMRASGLLVPQTIAVPTLVLAADQDRVAPADHMRELASCIPTARFVLVPDAGHLVNLEQPERFNAELSAFLDACESRPAMA
jgi:Predicted hydrolases or acyltransferases (alpha/beta hydrolase superfamily)